VVGTFVAAVWFFAANAQPAVAERVLEAVQEARGEAGLPPLARRDELDRVALAHAEHVAGLPHEERLEASENFGPTLHSIGIEARRLSSHLDFNRGYDDPAAAFIEDWSTYEPGWSAAMSGHYDQVGIASVRADDGWNVLVGILVKEFEPRPEVVPAEIEMETLAAVNEARRTHGLAPLAEDAVLSEVARAHSRDMMRRGYFDHTSPDGVTAQDRVQARGIEYRRVGENVHRSQGMDDPVATAVDAWLKSPGHRELLLSAEFDRTGVGIAVDGEGMYYFTQVFVGSR
jgi:uncharacterized protein YkwD